MEDKQNIVLDESNVKVEEYNCPNCEAALKFNPDKQVLYCEYCEFEMETGGTVGHIENDFLSANNTLNNWKDETKVVHCDNCGANTVVDNESISYTCPFCGSHSVVDTNELSGIKPHRVASFKISDKTVLNNYKNWLKKKLFVPKKVKEEIPKLNLRGVYLPVWTFDSDTFSIYKGKLGKYYTRTVGTGKNKRTVTEIRYFYVNGNEKIFFDDIIINAGSKITQNEISKIEPFNTNDSFNYNKSYLVGFSAEHYVTPINEGWNTSKEIIKNRIESTILSKYIYDTVSYLDVNTTYNSISYKYVLIPVWIGSYKYKEKTYRFISNGETGKVTGNTPISALKVIIAVLLIAIPIIIFLFAMNCQ